MVGGPTTMVCPGLGDKWLRKSERRGGERWKESGRERQAMEGNGGGRAAGLERTGNEERVSCKEMGRGR